MRNILVTGGSRGLGLAIVQRLAANGDRALVVSRRSSEALDAAIRTTHQRIAFTACDLADLDNIPTLVRDLRKQFGAISGLVNNAGTSSEGLLATMHNAQIEAMVRLNTVSPIVLTKYVVRHMMTEGAGRIVNMASIIGTTGYNGLAAYGATKASMIGFTKSLAREVGKLGITVNAVAPGFIETELTGSLSAEDRTRIAGRSALKRLAQADDVAHAVAYLLSDAARNVTGTVLTVDAGNTA